MPVDVSVIAPLLNEEKNVYELYNRIKDTLNRLHCTYEIILVDDGSKDNTLYAIEKLASEDPSVKYISFSRNFGHQLAFFAGLERCTGSQVILIDGDLQDQIVREGYRMRVYVPYGTQWYPYLMRRLADAGGAILLYSTEIPELVNLCDRVLVMYQGRIAAELVGEAIAEEAISRIAQLYVVEKEARGSPPDVRLALRKAHAAPVFNDLEVWLVLQLTAISGKSTLAAAIRYSYDRAVSTGAFYRLHFDLEEQSYKLESAKDRVLLTREKERAGRDGVGLDQDKEAARKEADEAQRYGTNQGLPPELLPPPSPRRARFEEFKDTTLPEIKLKRVRILSIYTARQPEPYTKGHAYLHFFPDGHTERAVIHMGTEVEDSDQYTLIVYGLTGRVEVLPGRVPPPPDFVGDSPSTLKGAQ